MTLNYQRTWEVLNELEMISSRICSAREILDSAIDALESENNEKATLLMYATDEYLQYYLKDFDEKFKVAWNEIIVKLKDNDIPEDGVFFCTDSTDDLTWKDWGNIKLGCDRDDPSDECKKSWNSFWNEDEYVGSTTSSTQYTEEELNAMCDKATSDQEKEKCREYNLREAEYYDKQAQLDVKQDKVVKWRLPVEVDGASGEYYIQFPDDLMEAAGIKEDDLVEWIDQGDSSYLLKKVPRTYDEMIATGYTMTDDGFWFKLT